ncbi:hypothetical protein RvY_14526 [Ramazzottius varieornatus]|uniref:Uncharacterized protein n=1 Tax=Ramazzottius varieornatus TaxID=947166 RepID=A0A1D1VYY4_RAMVA|nr:hypothetical protein RvY_14526 [Ramazzottius varieornatus]
MEASCVPPNHQTSAERDGALSHILSAQIIMPETTSGQAKIDKKEPRKAASLSELRETTALQLKYRPIK